MSVAPPSPTPSHDSDEASTHTTASAARLFACYLLHSRSPKPRAKNRTYIGFTVNPSRRLRQHNGDLRYGGAHRTKAYRPWAVVAVIHGFRCKTQALQFEWAWQHPNMSLTLRAHANRRGAAPVPKSRYSVQGALKTLAALVSVPPWARCPLTLTIVADRHCWNDLGIETLQLPPHFRIAFAPLNRFDPYVEAYAFRQSADTTLPLFRPSGCPVCYAPVHHQQQQQQHGGGPCTQTAPAQQRRLSHCARCGVVAHLACFAKRPATQPQLPPASDERADDGAPTAETTDATPEQAPLPLVPDAASCAACGHVMPWSLVVRLAHALATDDF